MEGLSEAVQTGVRSLLRNPGRSGLTVLGLAIGVATFIATVSFGLGARASVVDQFKWLGVDVVTVRRFGRVHRPLTRQDAKRLASLPAVAFVAPEFRWTGSLVAGRQEVVAEIRASTTEYFEIFETPVVLGGPFDRRDLEERSKVCVLGQTVVDALFPQADALGETLEVDGRMRCRVIGILESKGTATSGRDLDSVVLVPASTARTHLRGLSASYNQIHVRPQAGRRTEAEAGIIDVLRASHELREGQANDFVLRSPDQAAQVADEVASIMTSLLGAIAGVSLLVGGIGIMNIQLVAVAERTREIGIKAAIGASPRQILLQFLAEAVFLASLGTALGTAAGVGVALVVAEAMSWPTAVPALAIVIAILFGAGTGILFGLLPARRAAELDPIVALRQE
ncbi:MAG: ABC transporter permease [Myxococcota bacterium]